MVQIYKPHLLSLHVERVLRAFGDMVLTKAKWAWGRFGFPIKNDSEKKSRHSRGGKSKISKEDDVGIREASSTLESSQTIMYRSPKEAREEFHGEKADKSNEPMLRSSLKPSGAKKFNRSVTWADEKVEHRMNGYDTFGGIHKPFLKPSAENEAEFLAMELRQAAEAVASGESDVNGAVSKKTIAILARSG
ncbi:hypothetical protein ACFX13_010540 [Malus domestica]